MSDEEIVTPIKVVYDVQGVDRSIRSSQRLLYAMNALRLSIEDFKRLSEDPSLQNLLWTGIQLTRVWTTVHRLVTATNQAQRIGIAQGITGTVGRAATRSALGQTFLTFGEGGALGIGTAQRSLWSSVIGVVATNPIVAFGVGAAIATVGLVSNDMRQKRLLEDWRKRQREIAKSQGLEN